MLEQLVVIAKRVGQSTGNLQEETDSNQISQNGGTPEEQEGTNPTSNDHDSDSEAAASKDVDMAGFTPDQICNLVYDIKRRIARDKAVYQQKTKELYKGIGAKLTQIGASDDRTVRHARSEGGLLRENVMN